jgi:hypothetical protein
MQLDALVMTFLRKGLHSGSEKAVDPTLRPTSTSDPCIPDVKPRVSAYRALICARLVTSYGISASAAHFGLVCRMKLQFQFQFQPMPEYRDARVDTFTGHLSAFQCSPGVVSLCAFLLRRHQILT